MIFLAITCQMVDHIISVKILSGMFITLGTLYFQCFVGLPPQESSFLKEVSFQGRRRILMTGIRNFAFFPHVFLFILQTKLAMHCLI